MPEAVINSEHALQSAIGALRTDFAAHRWLAVKWRNGMKRSLDQNAIAFVWYGQLARELPEDDTKGWRRYCKLHHGVPIMRAEDADYRAGYDAIVKPRSYEEKLQAMDFWPVTSLMTKPQLSAYLEAVQADADKRGVKLEFPEPTT